jgi:DNA-3-methyladenine glycosylase
VSQAGTDPRSLLELPTLELARTLLGWRMVREDAAGRREGRIVELEAYLGEADQASHARFGRTGRNDIMYGPPGRAYVYLVYGMHDCLNIVTEPTGVPAALLVRAVEPLEGVDLMSDARARRAAARSRRPLGVKPATTARKPVPATRVAAGPGLVCAAFDLDRSLTGRDLFDGTSAVRIEPARDGHRPVVVVTGPRVGVGYAGPEWADRPWRFADGGSPSVSRPPLVTDADRPRT